jgi:hypothetical protein
MSAAQVCSNAFAPPLLNSSSLTLPLESPQHQHAVPQVRQYGTVVNGSCGPGPNVRRASSSACVGHRRSRDASATSASAVTHRARSTRSLGPNERAARRKSTLGFRKLAELSHGDPAQGERRRVVPKREPLERAQGVACLECSRCRRDERIHVTSYAVIGRHQKNPSHLLLPVRRRRS